MGGPAAAPACLAAAVSRRFSCQVRRRPGPDAPGQSRMRTAAGLDCDEPDSRRRTPGRGSPATGGTRLQVSRRDSRVVQLVVAPARPPRHQTAPGAGASKCYCERARAHALVQPKLAAMHRPGPHVGSETCVAAIALPDGLVPSSDPSIISAARRRVGGGGFLLYVLVLGTVHGPSTSTRRASPLNMRPKACTRPGASTVSRPMAAARRDGTRGPLAATPYGGGGHEHASARTWQRCPWSCRMQRRRRSTLTRASALLGTRSARIRVRVPCRLQSVSPGSRRVVLSRRDGCVWMQRTTTSCALL